MNATPTPPDTSHDEPTASALKLWVVLNRAHRAIGEHARRDIERHGLHPTEFAVLEVLLHRGPLPLGEVGSRILLTSGSVTHVVDKLEARGLVTRTPDPADRRISRAELTEEGRRVISCVFPEHAEAIRRAMDGLTPAERRVAADLLRRMGRFASEGA